MLFPDMTSLSPTVGSYLVVKDTNKFKLSDSVLNSFNNKSGKPLRIWDTHLKGFHVSITGKNKKTFFFTYRNSFNRKRWLKIGDFPKINTIQARKIVIQVYGKIIAGNDPVEENKKDKFGSTVSELSKVFLTHYCFSLKTFKQCENTFKKQINPIIGNKKISEVTKKDVLYIAQNYLVLGADGKPFKRLATFNKIRNLISKFYNWCIDEEFFKGTNPASRIKNFPTKFRSRYLKDNELKSFVEACKFYLDRNPLPTYAIMLLLITGRRKSEILNLTWSNLDLFSNTMFLPDSKTGPKSFRFSNQAKEIFNKIYQLLPKDASNKPLVDYVFPSNSKEGKIIALSNLKRPFRNILAKAKIENFRLHDLRHTFATHAALLSKDIRAVQQCLGHTTLKMTQRYSHFIEETQINTNELISQKVKQIVSF